jgi:hypothetical protein
MTTTIATDLAGIGPKDIAAASAAAMQGQVSPARTEEARSAVARRLLQLARALPADELAAAAAAAGGSVRGAVFDAEGKELEAAEDDLLCGVFIPDAGHEDGLDPEEQKEWDRLNDLRYGILDHVAARLLASLAVAA